MANYMMVYITWHLWLYDPKTGQWYNRWICWMGKYQDVLTMMFVLMIFVFVVMINTWNRSHFNMVSMGSLQSHLEDGIQIRPSTVDSWQAKRIIWWSKLFVEKWVYFRVVFSKNLVKRLVFFRLVVWNIFYFPIYWE